MTIKVPAVTINIIPAYQKEQNDEQRILFVGQKIASGTATPGVLYDNLDNANGQDPLFGKTSMLAGMVRAAKAINKVSRMDAIPLSDDGSAAAATGTIAFSGTATANGTIFVTIGSVVNHTYELDCVTTSSTATTIGDALVAAITADTTTTVTAVNTTGSVVLTAINKGLEGNKISLVVSGTVAGITYTNSGMSGGATNPSLTNLFNVIGGIRYQTIVFPSTYTVTSLVSLLNGRFNVDNNILDGIGLISYTDTAANLITMGNAQNTQNFAIHGNKIVSESFYKGSAILELDAVIASEIAAIRALRLTDGADISQYVFSANGNLDNFGGIAISSLPYFNTTFYNLFPMFIGREFTDAEIISLKDAGVFVLGNNRTRTNIIAGEVMTTYKTDAASNEDVSFKYMEYVDTSSNIREYIYNNLKTRFANSRLTNGDVIPNRIMANKQIIAAYLIGLYNDLATIYVLTQAGEDARNFFIQNLSITLDLAAGKITIAMITPIVTQLREINAAMQIAFSTNS